MSTILQITISINFLIQVPETFDRLAELLTTGPMVRHARDLRLLLDIMLGDNVKKVNKVPDMKQVRVLYMLHDGGSPLASHINNEMQDCIKKSVQHLERKFGVKPQVFFMRHCLRFSKKKSLTS